jgi:HEPN domain-containing protein
VLKEGSKGFLPHARALLRQVEKRASAALAAYKQGDYSLAEAKANQATALAKAVLKVVSAEPVMDLSQP